MKNYKDMADAVFARRDEYVASVKRKKKIAFNAGLSLCTICLAVLGAFGLWKSGVLTPDPNVLGTKPHSYTEPTEVTLSGNATSQGGYSDTAEHITGNSKPQNPTGSIKPQGTNPAEGTKPQSTDPAEKPDAPVIGPNLPSIPGINPNIPVLKPTLPIIKPTLPTVKPTQPVVLPTLPSEVVTEPMATGAIDVNPKPELPPTSPDYPKPDKPQTGPGPGRPPIVIPDVTMPPPPATNATDSEWPGVPDEPEYSPPHWPSATEPVVTEPCCTEPTESPMTPETQAPMEPTEPTVAPTARITVYGKVLDQNGNVVKGAKVTLYYSPSNYITVKTNDNGDYTFSSVGYRPNIYVKQTYAPNGYTCSPNTVFVDSDNNYGSNYIVFVCTKN